MSNLSASADFELTGSLPSSPILLNPRKVEIGTRTGIAIERTLPHREFRTIGAWCFVDHFGPTDQIKAMSVAAHPHTGLQTVTWLFQGLVEHRDSVGSVQQISPGELNLMTAGKGISHSELSTNQSDYLHGVQLWIVLPDEFRNIDGNFAHYENLPVVENSDYQLHLFIGSFGAVAAPVKVYSNLIGAEINIKSANKFELALDPKFEHGFLVISDFTVIDGSKVSSGSMIYFPAGKKSIEIQGSPESKIILLGGEPFEEPFIMWWNFIGRTHDEIVEMRTDWESRNKRFGSFEDQIGGSISAPPMPNLRLVPRR